MLATYAQPGRNYFVSNCRCWRSSRTAVFTGVVEVVEKKYNSEHTLTLLGRGTGCLSSFGSTGVETLSHAWLGLVLPRDQWIERRKYVHVIEEDDLSLIVRT